MDQYYDIKAPIRDKKGKKKYTQITEETHLNQLFNGMKDPMVDALLEKKDAERKLTTNQLPKDQSALFTIIPIVESEFNAINKVVTAVPVFFQCFNRTKIDQLIGRIISPAIIQCFRKDPKDKYPAIQCIESPDGQDMQFIKSISIDWHKQYIKTWNQIKDKYRVLQYFNKETPDNSIPLFYALATKDADGNLQLINGTELTEFSDWLQTTFADKTIKEAK